MTEIRVFWIAEHTTLDSCPAQPSQLTSKPRDYYLPNPSIRTRNRGIFYGGREPNQLPLKASRSNKVILFARDLSEHNAQWGWSHSQQTETGQQRQGPGLRDFSVRRSLTFRLGASRKLTDNTRKLSQPSSTSDPKGEKSDRQFPQHVLLRSNPFVRATQLYAPAYLRMVGIRGQRTLPACKRLVSCHRRWIVG